MSEQEERLAHVFMALPSPTAVLVRDVDGCWRLERVSDSFREEFISPRAPVGTPVAELLPGLGPLTRTLDAGGQLRGVETTCRATDGRHAPVLADVVPLAGQTGTAILQLQPRPPAGRRRVGRSTERHMREVANNVTALMYIKRTDGRYTFVNRYYESIAGTDLRKIRGRTDFDVWPKAIATSYRRADEQVMATGTPMEFEEPIPREGAVGMWLSLKFPLYDDDGSLYGVGGISTDISDRNEAEASIREARDEAERANREKSEFLSRMSHELRTPLNSILGFGQLLQLQDLPGPAASEVESIVSSGQHLLALINEVLDIARIESGTSGIDVEPVYVCEPLRAAFDMIKPLAAARGIELALDLHAILYDAVHANPQRLKQVFLNVLMNATKYNRPDGVVTVSGRVEGDRLRVLIADTGPGITEQDIDRIFAPFERLGAEHRDVEGTGLGLTVSKNLVEAMGGSLGVARSVVGRGTEFFVDLLVADPTALSPKPEKARVTDLSADLTGAAVLYIEDNATNIAVVSRILERSGHPQFTAAHTGAAGLRAARDKRPDVVLLDVNLPDMHGEEVLTALLEDPATAHIPVVVLSADATPAQHRRMLAAGAADYVTKPVDVQELLQAIQSTRSGRPDSGGLRS